MNPLGVIPQSAPLAGAGQAGPNLPVVAAPRAPQRFGGAKMLGAPPWSPGWAQGTSPSRAAASSAASRMA